jgi:hypothetical protein
MFSSTNNITPRTAALIAGLGLLGMAIIAPFSNFYVLENLVVWTDAKATAEKILSNNQLFRFGILGFLVVAILDVFVAWALYVLLEPVSKNLSLLATWFRLVYSAVFALVLNPLLVVLQLLDPKQTFATDQVQAQVMLALHTFKSGWQLSLIIFGFHLLVLGYVVLKSDFIPKWLGALLGIAGLGYVIDALGYFLIANYNISIAMFTFIGEVILIFWLLWYALKRTAA